MRRARRAQEMAIATVVRAATAIARQNEKVNLHENACPDDFARRGMLYERLR